MSSDTSKELIVHHVAVFHLPSITYSYLYHQQLREGTCVQVPLGRMISVGVIVAYPERIKDLPPLPDHIKLRKIHKVIDSIQLYSPKIMELAYFLSQYYLHPLGDVLKTMQPYGTTKAQHWQFHFHQKHHDYQDLLNKTFKRGTTLKKPTFLKNFRAACQECSITSSSETLYKLIENKIILREYSPPQPQSSSQGKESILDSVEDILESARQGLLQLSNDQYQVMSSIKKQLGKGFQKPWLIHGITGSGKTQIYLHLIYELLKQNPSAQILVMVPEISLTPQMTRIFTQVFGSLVGVVHSALPSALRHKELEAMRALKKQILIGPRSVVFAPCVSLKLIVVDEEHDSSYKQGSGLLYHGRDTAIKRAQIEDSTIVLGSATPSLESYYNASNGKYCLATLSRRVLGRTLPSSQLIEKKSRGRTGQIIRNHQDLYCDDYDEIDPQIIRELRENHRKGFQAMVIVQRRGFSHFLLDLKTHKTISCPYCSVSLTLHRHRTRLLCHYCEFSVPLQTVLKKHAYSSLIAIGQGSEKAYQNLKHHLPSAEIARLDSDIPKLKAELPRILQDFRDQKIDILVGTQMIAKGHDFPHVTLIALIEIDNLLRLPDFRAGEKAFQLIVQASGRSGRGENKGKVLIQLSRQENTIISEGLRQDYLSFYQKEIAYRRIFHYPPFTRMVYLELLHKHEERLQQICDDFKQLYLQPKNYPEQIKILGPSTPALELLHGKHRRAITLLSSHITPLHKFALRLSRWLQSRPENIDHRVNVDAQSVL